jgi:DNA-directed RNA polymerase II subunit RPB1
MTLNTFHAAGISSKNITLGVPRLKELLGVSKNIKSPGLTIYLNDNAEPEKVKNRLEYKTFKDIIKSTKIVSNNTDEIS